jgi:hypothetical protein
MESAPASRRRSRTSTSRATAKKEETAAETQPDTHATDEVSHASETPEDQKKVEKTVTKDDTTSGMSALALSKEKAGDIQASAVGSIWLRPVGPSQIEVVETISDAGLRPIAASHMEIYGTILNNRPIMASHIQLSETSLPGGRPIFMSDIVIREDLTLPGGRPVFASSARLMDAKILPGGRPIAANEEDDAELLMGYLD